MATHCMDNIIHTKLIGITYHTITVINPPQCDTLNLMFIIVQYKETVMS